MSDFEEANKKVHQVKDQWHFPIMKKHGWVAETLTGIGFVRSYLYSHEGMPNKVLVTTGCSADYWEDKTSGAGGYWASLEAHLKSLTPQSSIEEGGEK